MYHVSSLLKYSAPARGQKTFTTKDTKNELKKVNHKGHKDGIEREARKIKFL